jgi:hypothetical protein
VLDDGDVQEGKRRDMATEREKRGKGKGDEKEVIRRVEP